MEEKSRRVKQFLTLISSVIVGIPYTALSREQITNRWRKHPSVWLWALGLASTPRPMNEDNLDSTVFLETSHEVIVDAEHELLHGRGAWSKGQTDPVVITVAQRITATIVGKVIDESAKPIAHAGVGLGWEEGHGGRATSSPITETDSEGNFTVGPKFDGEWLEIGRIYQVYAKAANYGKISSEWFTLGEGARNVPDLVLPKAEYFIAGQVVDSQGRPISGAFVEVEGSRTRANTITDSEGKFHLKDIADSRVGVYAWHVGYLPSNPRAEFKANREDLQLVLLLKRTMLTDDKDNTIEPYLEPDPFPDPLEGKPAPELKVDRWFNTEPIGLGSLHDKVVVLNFWSSIVNSEGCAVWFSALNRIHDQYGNKGVVVIGVHTSADFEHYADIQGAIDQEQIRYPIGIATKDSENKFGYHVQRLLNRAHSNNFTRRQGRQDAISLPHRTIS